MAAGLSFPHHHMRTLRPRRLIAMLLGLALSATGLALAVPGAGAAVPLGYTCAGSEPADQQLLAEGTFGLAPGSSTLPLTVEVAVDAPESIGPGEPMDVLVTSQIGLPLELLGALQTAGVAELAVTDATVTVHVNGAEPDTLTSTPFSGPVPTGTGTFSLPDIGAELVVTADSPGSVLFRPGVVQVTLSTTAAPPELPEDVTLALTCLVDAPALVGGVAVQLPADLPTISMEQAGGTVVLGPPEDDEPVRLDGSPLVVVGSTQQVMVTEDRDDGAPWVLTASVSDFTTDGYEGACPAGEPDQHDRRCIPGDNLGWLPDATVAWPLVAAPEVRAGSPIAPGAEPGTGLGSQQRLLCGSAGIGAPGTYACGAGLALLVPGSASAGTYQATLTITLV
jgi:hypothetical protein